MTRYRARKTKAKHVEADTELDAEKYLSSEVYDDSPRDTGLLDASGLPIFAEMEPIGFVRPKEL